MGLKVGAVWMVEGDQLPSNHSLVTSSTTDYDKFTFDPVQREVKPERVAALIKAINTKNLLREYPIVVDVNYVILDGQHRLKAAEALQVPIYYIVSKDMTTQDVGPANSRTGHWSMEDYMRYWCVRGNPDYLTLFRFHESHPKFSLSICRDLLTNGNRRTLVDDFENGLYKASRMEFGERVAAILTDFSRHTTLYVKRGFVNAIMNVMANPKYDHHRMMQKLDYLSSKLKKCADTKAYIEMLSAIYNYKAVDKVEFKQVLRAEIQKARRTHPNEA